MPKRKLILWLLAFVRPLSGKMALATLLGTVSGLAVIAIPLIGGFTALEVLDGNTSRVMLALFVMLFCGLIRGIGRYLEQFLNHDIAFRLLALVRQKAFHVMRQLGAARIAGKKSGDLVTLITSDVEALEVFFAHTVSPCLIAISTAIVTITCQTLIHAAFGLILLVGQLIVGVVIPVLSYSWYQKHGDDYQGTFAALNQTVMENVTSLDEIIQFHLEDQRTASLNQKGAHLNQEYHKRLRQRTWIQVTSEAVLVLTSAATLLIGYWFTVPFPSVFLATILSLSSFGSVLALSGLGNALLATFASGQRLYNLMHETPAVTFQNASATLSEASEIAAERVSFTYPKDKTPTLTNISLALKKGTITGIGGASGSGKSTFLKLLARSFDPSTGQITINQHPLTSLMEENLRQLEGLMEQDTFLFEDSIANNISLGKKTVSQAAIEQAAKKAALHEWILTLPAGYDTILTPRERLVSDGERQRIGLARLFLHNSPILLLDEPTSSLDYVNEKAIMTLLKDECQEKAVLIISHRETTLAVSSTIYEMNAGTLREVQP